MITTTGWTYEYVNKLEFPTVTELMTYWADYPPTHMLMRGYVGYKGTTPQAINDSRKPAEDLDTTVIPDDLAFVLEQDPNGDRKGKTFRKPK